MKLSIQPLLPIGNFLNKRYGIEMDFPDDSNPMENYKYLNEIVTAIHMSEYPQCYKDGKPLFSNYKGEEEQPSKHVEKVTDEVQAILDGINGCTEMEGESGLSTWWLKSKGNLTLSAAYKEKEKQLNK